MDSRVQAAEDIASSNEQIRLRMRSQVGPFCGEIAQTADRIIADSPDPAVRRAALLWKIEAVPAMREALFQPNPGTAVLDSWVLSFQMAQYFENGPGKASLGAGAPIAAAGCRRIEGEIGSVVSAMLHSGDISRVRGFAEKWAAEHPIMGSIAGRQSTLSRALENDAPSNFTAGEAVAEITTTVDDLNRRVGVYSDQLLLQARWEAQLLAADMARDAGLADAKPLAERALRSAEDAVATLDRLAPLLEQAVKTATGAPTLIANERVAALAALRDEITRTLAFLQEQRIAALQQLTKERTETMLEVRTDIASERQALTGDLEKLGVSLVDHAFLRLAQLLAVVLGVTFVGLIVLLKIWRR